MVLWNFTIDDTSPYLTYSPFGDGPSPSAAWQTWYTMSQFNKVPGQASQGDSFHITSARNASVTVHFIGTGIALFGFGNSSFDVSIDNGPRSTINTPTVTNSLLYSNYDLANGPHSATLQVDSSDLSQSLAFDSAIVAIPLGDDEGYPSPLFQDIANTQSMLYSGNWSNSMQDGVPNTTVSAPFRKTAEVGASMSFTFTGANAIAVKGLTTPENGLYSVSLDGSTKTFNATSLWIVPDALLFFSAGLDPTSTHQLNLTNLGSRLNLNSIMTFKQELKGADPPTTSNSLPSKQSINAGIILGPALSVVLLIVLGMFFWYRRTLAQPSSRRFFSIQALTFTKPKRALGLVTPIHSRRPAAARLSSNASDDGSSRSDAHSSTHILNASSGFYRRDLYYPPSSDGVSEAGPANSLTDSDGGTLFRDPNPLSHISENYGYALARPISTNEPLSTFPQSTQESRAPVSDSSASETGSSLRNTPLHEYMATPPRVTFRKPLPIIPSPPYDAALRDQNAIYQSPSYNVSGSTDYGSDTLHAPPRYER